MATRRSEALPSVRVVPMNSELEPGATLDPKEFFLRDLPTRAGDDRGAYFFRARGPRAEPGTVLLFQARAKIVADATLIELRKYETPDGEYSGCLILDVESIRVFEPAVTHGEFRSIWPGRSLSQAWHALDASHIREWNDLVSKKRQLRV